MIKPAPFTYTCKTCNWSKTVAPKSDVLILGFTVFRECPKCGGADLKHSKPSPLEYLRLGLDAIQLKFKFKFKV